MNATQVSGLYYNEGLSLGEVGRELGVDHTAVYQFMKRRSWPRRPAHSTGTGQDSPYYIDLPSGEIVAAYRAGQSLRDIGVRYDVSGTTIGRVLKECGEPLRIPSPARSYDYVKPRDLKLDNARWSRLRRACFKRDKHKCRCCGSNKALRAHHVAPRQHFPELVWELDNLITLCSQCHWFVHNCDMAYPMGLIRRPGQVA